MNDAQSPPNGSEQVMQSAAYFRDQAALCLEIARHISDPGAVENLHASAAQHLMKADDAEKRNAVKGTLISEVGSIPPLRYERSGVDPPCLVAPPEPVKPFPKALAGGHHGILDTCHPLNCSAIALGFEFKS